MRILVTGSSGFIGFHLVRRLLEQGHSVVGVDGMTPYYDVRLKHQRQALLQQHQNFLAVEGMLEDSTLLEKTVLDAAPEVVVHLAAQAGVRYSIEAPRTYHDANLTGTFNLLEILRRSPPDHLLFASTSSVYGGNAKRPYAEHDRTDFPMSLYAATKKAGEAMSHSYAYLFGIPTTAMRFFTVYGPWGRPDMALFKFVSAILGSQPIDVYGGGNMRRDFTYVDDLVEAITLLMPKPPTSKLNPDESAKIDSLSPVAPWRSVNIAGGRPVELMRLIDLIETALGRPAIKNVLGLQAGDPVETQADPQLLHTLTGFVPQTSIEAGVERFVRWYVDWVDQ